MNTETLTIDKLIAYLTGAKNIYGGDTSVFIDERVVSDSSFGIGEIHVGRMDGKYCLFIETVPDPE